MAAKSSIKILTDFFNQGDGKRPTREWGEELKTFTKEERDTFASEVAAVTGDTLLTTAK